MEYIFSFHKDKQFARIIEIAGKVLNLFTMLKFILTCALVGGLIGLVFSRSGEGSKGFTEGAKKGIGIGCGCVTVSVVLLILLFFMIVGLLAI